MHTTQQQHVRLERRLGVAGGLSSSAASIRQALCWQLQLHGVRHARARATKNVFFVSYLNTRAKNVNSKSGGGEGGEK
jgi:hypothetical protein